MTVHKSSLAQSSENRKLPLAFTTAAIVVFRAFCALSMEKSTPKVWELIPPEREKPIVFSSAPGAFAGISSVQTLSIPIQGTAIFKDMPVPMRDFALVMKVRATDENTAAAELGLHQSDGKTWGVTFPLERKWREVRIPREKLGTSRTGKACRRSPKAKR